MPSCFHLIWNALVITSCARSTWFSTELVFLMGPPSPASDLLLLQLQTRLLLTAVGFGTIVFLESQFSHFGVHSLILLEYSFWLFPKEKCLGSELFKFAGVWKFL